MKKLTGAIVTLTFTVAAATHAYATGFGDRIASKLDLTPEQTVQFQEVQSKRKAHMEDALKIRDQIKALASSGDVDGAAILAGQQAEKKVLNIKKNAKILPKSKNFRLIFCFFYIILFILIKF